MLSLPTGSVQNCDGVSRRQFMQIGGLSALAFGLPDFLKLRASAQAASVSRCTDMSCIFIWLHGGPSHIDTLDPKPEAPVEIRGEFGVTDTCLPGVQITEHLPRLAKELDKTSIIRSLNPQQGSHGLADHIMMSGHKFNPAMTFPCFGSVIAQERGYQNDMLPFVQLNRSLDRRFNGGSAGFLGDQFNPFEVMDDPNKSNFRVRDISLAKNTDPKRFNRRHAMLNALEGFQQKVDAEASASVRTRDVYYEKAFSLITSPAAKKAFDLTSEPDKLRDHYGRHQFGQSCLLARRLIEAGVHFVTITSGGWDTHQNNFRTLGKTRLPQLDQGYAALLQDLHSRGLLDNTLVVCTGDFGRTPKVNSSAGRDHWSTASVATMGGGGVKMGEVVGRTNPLAEHIVDAPVTPQDIAATIYHSMGVPLSTWYRSHDGRPIELVPEGKIIRQLVA